MKKFTFGPVPSRRLGFSLGIDIIPLKTCTYNCVYCQLFQTSKHTVIRQSFIDKELVLNDIKESIDKFSNIDYLTFSGSGEPTLNKDLGWLISQVKKYSEIPVAVITNSSLLWMPDVIEDLKHADLVVPSVDCVTETIWQK
ncbi:MAG: radical SAM protein, partial [Cyanobacteriota bacterium]